jgi:ATP-dependent DNA helicase RecG
MTASDPQRLVDLVDDLLAQGEVPWVEFKHNNTDADMIGVRVSAISNAARLSGQQIGFMLWGVVDAAIHGSRD